MKELIIAFGLFLFIEGILYALFPSKMRNMLKKLESVNNSQLRIGGMIFAILGFVLIYYLKSSICDYRLIIIGTKREAKSLSFL